MAKSTVPEPIPWRRILGLLRPIRGGLAAMVGLSVVGTLLGLVPPLALGVLVNTLVEFNDKQEAGLMAAAIAAAMLAQGAAYIASDGMYARNTARLDRDLRLMMFEGSLRRTRPGPEDATGLPSRFISDVQSVQQVTVSVLDTGSMVIVQFLSALVALALIEPLTLAVAVPMLGATWVVTRRMQEPAASAGQRRQEELERMTRTLAQEYSGEVEPGAVGRFRVTADRVRSAEIRVGWLQAANLHASGALAMVGPIAVVVASAFAGSYRAGTLLTLYLLAQRTYWGFDGLVDLSLGVQSVRGPIARCFALIDAKAPGTSIAA